MGAACGTYGDRRSAPRVLMGRPEEKRPLGRLRCIWKNDFKMDLQEVEYGSTDWICSMTGKGGGLL